MIEIKFLLNERPIWNSSLPDIFTSNGNSDWKAEILESFLRSNQNERKRFQHFS